MTNLFISLLISIMFSFGLSVALVEKSKEWPIKPWRVRIQAILRKIYWKLPRVFYCQTCMSFWTAFISDLCLMIFLKLFMGQTYFLWPISGFISLGTTWVIIEFLNSNEQYIHIYNTESSEEKTKNE